MKELEEEILKVVKKKRTFALQIANLLPHYARGKVLQMVWRLIDRGVIKIDVNNNLYLTTEREMTMTKNTNTTSNVRSEAARKAHETRRCNANAERRSNAAKKAWETRRANAERERRSEAAKKAWATRRGN